MQTFIHNTRNSPDKQWIFDLIAYSNGHESSRKEPIIINCDAWFMCHNILTKESISVQNIDKQEKTDSNKDKQEIPDQNKSNNTDSNHNTNKRDRYDKEPRYLVIFKDTNLSTLRDLRMKHTGILRHMQEKVLEFLQKHHTKTWHLYRIFFHYLPSVFQLHAHVSARRNSLTKSRQHHVTHVLKNLQRDPDFYSKCLIITSLGHQLRRHNLYNEIIFTEDAS